MKKTILSCVAIGALFLVGCDDTKSKDNSVKETVAKVEQSVASATNEETTKTKSIVNNVSKSLEQTTQAVSEKVSKSIEKASEKVSEKVNEGIELASKKVNDVVDNASEKVGEVIENASDKVSEKVNEVVDNVSEKLAAVSKTPDAAAIFKKCSACHGKKAEKLAPGAPVVINTLSEEEIYNALSGYKAGTFGGKSQKTMQLQVKNLNDDDFKALAKYIKSL